MDTKQILDKTKRRLGRGLSSLIGDAVPVQVDRVYGPMPTPSSGGAVGEAAPGAAPTERRPPTPPALNNGAGNGALDPGPEGGGAASGGGGAAASEGGIKHIGVGAIVPSRFQPRREMDPGALAGLADSIKRSGMMQPVIVRPAGGGSAGYELVAGERRWRAAQMAGLERIPALVRDLSDEESAEWALVENLQREDLNPMDRAASLRLLCERFGLRQEDVAARVGLDRSTVTNLIRLTELEEPLAKLVAAALLTAGHGRALLSLPAGPARIDLGMRSAREGWSVRRLETEVGELLGPAARKAKARGRDPIGAREAARVNVERALEHHLQTKVRVTTDRSGAKGKITIEFWGLDHFESVLTKLGVDPRVAV